MRSKVTAYWESRLDRLDERDLERARKLPTWRTRRRRRQLSAVVVVADVAIVTAAALFLIGPAWLFFTLWCAPMIVGGIAFSLLRVLTGRISGGFSRLLDEREREWRHRISFIGYQALAFLMILAMFYGLAIAHQHDSGYRGALMLSALLVAGTTVPPIVLGWSLPDDDPEDFEEGKESA